MFLFLQWTQGGFGAREKRLGKEKNENLLKITFMIVPEGDVCSLELNFQLFWSNFSVFLPHRMENQVILQLAGEKNQGPTLFTPKWTWMLKCRGWGLDPFTQSQFQYSQTDSMSILQGSSCKSAWVTAANKLLNLYLNHIMYGKLWVVRILTIQWGFTRPFSINISLGIVRDIVPPVIWYMI